MFQFLKAIYDVLGHTGVLERELHIGHWSATVTIQSLLLLFQHYTTLLFICNVTQAHASRKMAVTNLDKSKHRTWGSRLLSLVAKEIKPECAVNSNKRLLDSC